MQTDLLETALDDLDGLFEAYRAMGIAARRPPRRKSTALADLRGKVIAAADAYLTTLIATAGGNLTAKRINARRRQAKAAMKIAFSSRDQIAAIANRQRLPAQAIRADLA